MDERQQRVGHNEALFRTVNERIEGLNDAFQVVINDFQIVCECGDLDCLDQLTIPTAEYKRIREDPTLFVLLPGHQDATAEAVVEEHQETTSSSANTPAAQQSTPPKQLPSGRRANVQAHRDSQPAPCGAAPLGHSLNRCRNSLAAASA